MNKNYLFTIQCTVDSTNFQVGSSFTFHDAFWSSTIVHTIHVTWNSFTYHKNTQYKIHVDKWTMRSFQIEICPNFPKATLVAVTAQKVSIFSHECGKTKWMLVKFWEEEVPWRDRVTSGAWCMVCYTLTQLSQGSGIFCFAQKFEI